MFCDVCQSDRCTSRPYDVTLEAPITVVLYCTERSVVTTQKRRPEAWRGNLTQSYICLLSAECVRQLRTVDRGGTVVKVLCYNSESRWFDPRWCLWNFSLT